MALIGFFGMGIQYGRFGFNRPSGNHPNSYKGDKHINYGAVYDFTFYGSLNYTNFLLPYWKRWNIYINLGAGIGYYEGNLADFYAFYINNNVDLWTGKPFLNGKYNGITPVLTSFFGIEYDVSYYVALGLGVGYRNHFNNGLGGLDEVSKTINPVYGGNIEVQKNDGWNATFSLHFKLIRKSYKLH